jgi:hypothetical protein
MSLMTVTGMYIQEGNVTQNYLDLVVSVIKLSELGKKEATKFTQPEDAMFPIE